MISIFARTKDININSNIEYFVLDICTFLERNREILTVSSSWAFATAICCLTSLINWSFWVADRLPTAERSIVKAAGLLIGETVEGKIICYYM